MYVLGSPPSITDVQCFLFTSIGGSFDISLQWSEDFNSRYKVEGYHVTVTPDPSSCSRDHVPPYENYHCSALNPATNNTIMISAINCGDQEGESVSFSVQSHILGTYFSARDKHLSQLFAYKSLFS